MWKVVIMMVIAVNSNDTLREGESTECVIPQ